MSVFGALFVLLFSSAWDWPWHVLTRPGPGGRYPKWPSEEDFYEAEGSWYHMGKNFWTELNRKDARWWNKFYRFITWWLVFLWLI